MQDAPGTVKPGFTVFVHVHYPAIWDEIGALLVRRVARPFRLVVTSAHPVDAVPMPSSPALVSSAFIRVDNRGRDVLPFLHALGLETDFGCGLKLHTKKSPQREDGALWRAAVLDALLPGPAGVDAIVERLDSDPRIGFVAPGGFCLSVRPWVLVNAQGLRDVMASVGPELVDSDLEDCCFAAGSMFWFRRPALAGLASPRLHSLFEPEEGQLDGTIAHATERAFAVEARRRGFVSLAVPALLASSPAMPMGELLALARMHADVPSTFFPAPNVPALPPVPEPQPVLPRSRLRVVLSGMLATLPGPVRALIRRLRGR